MMLSGTVVPSTRLTVVDESCREKIKCTLVPLPGSAHVGEMSGCLQGPECAPVPVVGATAMVIENFDENPVTTVGFVEAVLVSRELSAVTLISGSPATPAATVWRQTRFVGGALE